MSPLPVLMTSLSRRCSVTDYNNQITIVTSGQQFLTRGRIAGGAVRNFCRENLMRHPTASAAGQSEVRNAVPERALESRRRRLKSGLSRGDLDLDLMRGSLSPLVTASQTESRSVHPFLQGPRLCPAN